MLQYKYLILHIIIIFVICISNNYSQVSYSYAGKTFKEDKNLAKQNLPKGNCLAYNDNISNISKYTGDILFFEDFENGQGNWIIRGGVWQIGTPSYGHTSAYSGKYCAGTNLDGDYPDYADATLISPTISLPSVPSGQSLRIRYYSWWKTETDYDFIYLKISIDNGNTWSNIAVGSGDSQGWEFRDFNISSFAGKNIKIAFQLVSDGSYNYDGWYIDNVSIELVDSVAIEVVVASNGQFTAGVANGPILLYGHPDPWSSATTIRIDNVDYWNYFNTFWGDIIDPPKWRDGLTNAGTWAVADGIRVTQTIRIVKSFTTRIFDTIELRYKIVNASSSSHQVGIRIMLDTMLGTNDGAPFRVPGFGAITTDMEWFSNNMPHYFQAFDDLNHPTIQSQGSLIGGNATKPDRFITTGWYNIKQTQWNYDIVLNRDFYNPQDGGFLDSAVGIYWFPITLEPGDSKEFVTYYGLGGVDIDLQPPLVVGLSAPLGLVFLNGNANDNPFQLSVYLSNTSPGVTQTAVGVTTTLNLTDGLVLTSDETSVHNIPDMTIGAEQSTSYKIKALSNASGNKTYSLTVTATNITTKTVQKNIYIWGITTSPVNDAQVDVNTHSITAQFNVPLKSETINGSTFRVIDDFGNVLLSNVTYNSNERKAILTLLDNLSPNKHYKVILSSSVQSTDGVNLPNDVEWSFKTSSEHAFQQYRIFTSIDSVLVEMDENGNVIAKIDSGFSIHRAPIKDIKSNSIWVRVSNRLGQMYLRKYSLDSYKKILEIKLPTSGVSWLGSTFAQSDFGDTIFVGIATSTYSGDIYKIWGNDAALNGYNLSGTSGSNHKIIVTGWDGRADVISYQKYDNTLLTAGGDVHSFYKFTTSGAKVWSIVGLENHVNTHIASPYENASFTGRNWPEMKKISGNGNTIFTVNVAFGGGSNAETSLQPTADGGIVACVKSDWYLNEIYIRKYSNDGSQIFNISGLDESNRDHICYYDTVNGNTIWLIKKFNQDSYLIKLSGTDSQLQNYNLQNPNGQNHIGFKLLGMLTGSVLIIKSSSVQSPTNSQPSFTFIEPHLNRTASVAMGVSNDGRVVVGYTINGSRININGPNVISSDDNTQRAFIWTSSTGTRDLGSLGLEKTWANSVSGNGNVVVGGCYTGSYDWRAYLWTNENGMKDLGSLGIDWVDATDVSEDGKVIVGYSYAPGDYYWWAVYAIRWKEETGMVNLGTLSGYRFTSAYAVSRDGKIIVGEALKDAAPDWHKKQAFLWKEETGIMGLGTISNFYSYATGVSPDGSAVIGILQNGEWPDPMVYPYYSFIWKENLGMKNLGTLGGNKTYVWHAVSRNGDLVFGSSQNSNGEWRAFIWSETEGMKDLNQIYNQYIPSGWVIRSVNDCSEDGRFLVGIAENTSGVVRGYILDRFNPITSVSYNNDIVISTNFVLSQNFPNPFNPITTIKYSIPKSSFVTLKVYDVLGREITTLINEEKQPGNYEVQFDGSNLSSGVYFYTMQAGNFVQTKKLVLIK